MPLNVEQLEQSFAQLKGRELLFTQSFYDTLFAEYPEVKPLFKETHMETQQQKLFQSLVLVVDNLRNGDVLGSSLKGLGARHVKYGILPIHYPMVGGALLKTFEQLLGTDWTPELQQCWVDAYQAVTTIMLEGADYSQEILAL